MTRLLHTRSKIFFANPYVVRIEYEREKSMETAMSEHRTQMRKAYKLFRDTWGYSNLEYEQVQIKNDHNHPAPPGPNHFNGMNQNQLIASLFDGDFTHLLRGYLCFKDELDALQFRLSIDTKAVQVHMWPASRFFTIYEYINES